MRTHLKKKSQQKRSLQAGDEEEMHSRQFELLFRHFQGNVTPYKENHTHLGMSQMLGKFTFSRESQTFLGMSHLLGNVK